MAGQTRHGVSLRMDPVSAQTRERDADRRHGRLVESFRRAAADARVAAPARRARRMLRHRPDALTRRARCRAGTASSTTRSITPRYPAHMNVAVNAGEYAWKPVIVAEVVDRVRAGGEPRDVLWADAGCFFHALEPIGRAHRGQRRPVGADVGRHDAAVDAPADVRVSRRRSRRRTATARTRTRRSSASRSAARRRTRGRPSIATSSRRGRRARWPRTASRRTGRRAGTTGRIRRCCRISCIAPAMRSRTTRADELGVRTQVRSLVLSLHRVRRAARRVRPNLPGMTSRHHSCPLIAISPQTHYELYHDWQKALTFCRGAARRRARSGR